LEAGAYGKATTPTAQRKPRARKFPAPSRLTEQVVIMVFAGSHKDKGICAKILTVSSQTFDVNEVADSM